MSQLREVKLLYVRVVYSPSQQLPPAMVDQRTAYECRSQGRPPARKVYIHYRRKHRPQYYEVKHPSFSIILGNCQLHRWPTESRIEADTLVHTPPCPTISTVRVETNYLFPSKPSRLNFQNFVFDNNTRYMYITTKLHLQL